MRQAAIVASLALLLSACGTFQVGGNFDLATFEAKVERGKSTQADVQRWLGAPDSRGVSVETDGARYTQWTYYYGSGNLSGPTNARVKLLQVKFDRAGVVRAYNWSGQAR
jgi:outer membrane protein assembly factor BamE (lipoprotein component of BamABCDE complex)